MESPLILVVEDEPPMRHFLRVSLTASGYRVVEAATGEEAIVEAASQPPDVILLDLGLPGMDGFQVTRTIREWSQVPIIVLSARGREGDKVDALDAGADDYVTKPLAVLELLARVRVALRHTAMMTSGEPEPLFETGDLRVDVVKRRVFVRSVEVHLTPIAYRLLMLFIRNAGKVLTHRQILKEVWGPNATDPQYVRVYMGQLRQKIEPDPTSPRYLITEPAVGYRFRVD
jgi:two-component system KDP operon response regulator KdpE